MLKQYEGVYYAVWPVKDAKAAVIMVHGMGAHSGRWQGLSERLNAEKISCYGIELQGFGETAGEHKGHVDSLDVYHKALITMKKFVLSENPGRPVFILGESMGGMLATYQVIGYDSDFAGLVSIAPAYKDVLKISLMQRLKIFIASLTDKSQGINMPFVNEELTSDPVMLEKLKGDNREHKVASAGLLVQNLLEQAKIIQGMGKIKIPVLMLLAGRDYLIDTPFAIELFKKLQCDKKYIAYPDSLHALTIEKNREEVFGDIVKWMNSHITKKP